MTDLPRGHTVNPLTNPPEPRITGPATPPPTDVTTEYGVVMTEADRYQPPPGYDPEAWANQVNTVLARAPQPSENQIRLAVSLLRAPQTLDAEPEAA